MDIILRRFINLYDENCRTPLTQIAKKLRRSQQSLSYIRQVLLDKQILQGHSVLFDPAYFGFHGYVVFFRLLYNNRQEYEQFATNLKDIPEVCEISTTSPKYDLVCFFLAPNPSAFNKLINEITAKNSQIIRKREINTVVVSYKFLRDYLLPEQGEHKYHIYGGDRALVSLNEQQRKICEILYHDPVAQLKTLSEKADCSFITASKTIKELETKNIILGFKPVYDLGQFDIKRRYLLVSYRDVTAENALVEFCKLNRHVVGLHKTFGNLNMIIYLEYFEFAHFEQFMIEFKQRFDPVIDDFETLMLGKLIKEQYVPSTVFAPKEIKKA